MHPEQMMVEKQKRHHQSNEYYFVIYRSYHSQILEIFLIHLDPLKNLYSLEIENISDDILNNNIEASYPGTNKNEILISSQILDEWLNEKK